jgi:hypothetical protein
MMWDAGGPEVARKQSLDVQGWRGQHASHDDGGNIGEETGNRDEAGGTFRQHSRKDWLHLRTVLITACRGHKTRPPVDRFVG